MSSFFLPSFTLFYFDLYYVELHCLLQYDQDNRICSLIMIFIEVLNVISFINVEV